MTTSAPVEVAPPAEQNFTLRHVYSKLLSLQMGGAAVAAVRMEQAGRR
jgi:hypothetical protein